MLKRRFDANFAANSAEAPANLAGLWFRLPTDSAFSRLSAEVREVRINSVAKLDESPLLAKAGGLVCLNPTSWKLSAPV